MPGRLHASLAPMTEIADELRAKAAECRARAKSFRERIERIAGISRAELREIARHWDDMAARYEALADTVGADLPTPDVGSGVQINSR